LSFLIWGDDEVSFLGALITFTGIRVFADVAPDDGGTGLVLEDVDRECEGEEECDKDKPMGVHGMVRGISIFI